MAEVGARVKLSPVEGTVTHAYTKDIFRMLSIDLGGGLTAEIPSGFVDEVFRGEDGAVYQDNDGDVFVYREYDNLFTLVVTNGRADTDGDTFSYEGLCHPIVKIASVKR